MEYKFVVTGFWVVLLVLLALLSHRVDSEPTQDKQALLAFISQIPHANRLQWNASDSACNWVGVVCDSNRSFVFSLRLPAAGLVGQIPANTIGNLTQLRILSLRANRLSGQIPSDFSNLKLLRSLYLQNNKFSGEFPASIPELTRLNRLDLSNNNFTGSIPYSINNLTQLSGLLLENNGFTGTLPSISNLSLVNFNVSYNRLTGSIPASLSKFPASSFAGNLALCGGPLPPCNPFFPSPSPSPSSIPVPHQNPPPKNPKKLSKAAIIGISVGSAVLLLVLLVILILCLRKSRGKAAKTQKPAATARSAAVAEAGTSSSKDDITGGSGEGERNKLVFFQGGIYSFDLEDLLRASAEVLGKGSVGTSYKAVLEEGTTVVVKRLKDVVVNKKEFEMHLDALGKIKHDNVVPLRAYYYSKDEKLLVSDYMSAGSLSALLHGSRGSGRTPLDWDSRLRIALTTAKGLAHLHVSSKMVHGNIKASNILLRHDPPAAASVSDFGLIPLFASSTQPSRAAGYRAPELLDAHAAARAYDRAAIKFRGVEADINFPIKDYEDDMKEMTNLTKEEFVHILRRQSTGFSRGSSKYRGVTLHKCGRWEARMGQFLGKKAYDKAAIKCNGREAVTNFEPSTYEGEMISMDANNADGGTSQNLDLNLWIFPPADVPKGNVNVRDIQSHCAACEMPDGKRPKVESSISTPTDGQNTRGLTMASKHPPIRSGIYPSFTPNYEERAIGKSTEALPSLAFSNWAWQMQSHSVVSPVALFSTAASSGFSSPNSTAALPATFPPQNKTAHNLYIPTPTTNISHFYNH